MGVKGLWAHLAPAGRKIQISDLEGKTIAIDASIWAMQFLSLMTWLQNPDNTEDLLEAQNEFKVVDGFLRRILKLLFFGIRPVFVFDGKTPALKMKTLKDRRLARKQFGGDGAAVNMKKAAEKILDRVITDNLRQKVAEEAVSLSKEEEKEPESKS